MNVRTTETFHSWGANVTSKDNVAVGHSLMIDGLPCTEEHDRYVTLEYNAVIMSAMASQITSLTIVNSTVYSGTDEWEHQSSASLASGTGEFPAQRANNAKMFPFHDVIMSCIATQITGNSIRQKQSRPATKETSKSRITDPLCTHQWPAVCRNGFF